MKLVADQSIEYLLPDGALDRCRVRLYREPDQTPAVLVEHFGRGRGVTWPPLIRTACVIFGLHPELTYWLELLPEAHWPEGVEVVLPEKFYRWRAEVRGGRIETACREVAREEVEELIGHRLEG